MCTFVRLFFYFLIFFLSNLIQNTQIYICASIRVKENTHIPRQVSFWNMQILTFYMYVPTHDVNMSACMLVYECAGERVSFYTHLKSYIHMYACIYVCTDEQYVNYFSMYHRNIKFIFIFTFYFVLFYILSFVFVFFFSFSFSDILFYFFLFFFAFLSYMKPIYANRNFQASHLAASVAEGGGLGWIGFRLGWYIFSSSTSHIYILSLIMLKIRVVEQSNRAE